MSAKRSIPDHAIHLWIEGDVLYLCMPPKGEGRSHYLTLPMGKCSVETNDFGQPLGRQRGWMILIDILRQREKSGRTGIGTKGDPVQYDVERMLVAMATGQKSKAKVDKLIKQVGGPEKMKELLKELDLI